MLQTQLFEGGVRDDLRVGLRHERDVMVFLHVLRRHESPQVHFGIARRVRVQLEGLVHAAGCAVAHGRFAEVLALQYRHAGVG